MCNMMTFGSLNSYFVSDNDDGCRMLAKTLGQGISSKSSSFNFVGRYIQKLSGNIVNSLCWL